jgi:hypothetical protein
METAVFSAASLFHADDDSDDDGRRGKVIPDPRAQPAPPLTSPPIYLIASFLRLPFRRFKTRRRWAPRGRARSGR